MDYDDNKHGSDFATLFQRAATCFKQGQLDAAEALVRVILNAQPEQADTHHLMGLIAGQQGRHEQANLHIARAIRICPHNASYHLNHALALIKSERPDDALTAYEQAIRLNPTIPEAYFRYGNLLKDLGHRKKAVIAYGNAIRLRPEYLESHYNLGNVFRSLGQPARALPCYRQAIALNPNFIEAHNNLGATLLDLGNPAEALVAYDRAVELKPDYANSHNNRGMALIHLDRRADALASFDQAIILQPDLAEAHNNRGLVLKAMGKLEEACENHRRALSLKPYYDQAHDNLLLTLNYHPELSPEELFTAHVDWARQHASTFLPGPHKTCIANGDDNRRLRIGYISPDFRTHSVAWFFEPLISAHNSDSVEIFCYSNVLQPDDTTTRIRSKAHHWRSVAGLSDDSAAEQIRKDRIDILIDLAGHTANNRLLVFARRPAPVQVTWLGYPNTTGMQTVDYRFTDAVADPQGDADSLHSEKLVRLPQGFLCYQPPEYAPSIAETPAIRNGYITFGSFNNLAKVNPCVIEVWAKILCAIPNSHLLLKDKALADDITRKHYLSQFREYGISDERVELHGRQLRIEDHLGIYNRIDIGLDPFPYNGTTTTCEALWMGVPVVTLCGNRHAGRVGASILQYAGFVEWVATDMASYIQIAARLADSATKLNVTRLDLRPRFKNSPLCDADTFARTVEDAYRRIWRDYSQTRR